MHLVVYIKFILKVAFPSSAMKDCVAMFFVANLSVIELFLSNLTIWFYP